MKILIATDKFKDSLTAKEVCEGLMKGILRTFPSAEIETLPLADGGEGTLETLQSVWGGEFVSCEVQDPLSRKISANYLWIEEKATAIIEMARASGIELLKPNERNCLITSTYGTGELIKDAIEKGAKEIILTVGGSATNDAGIGMASALGYKFLDKSGKILEPIGKNLIEIFKINTQNTHPKLSKTKFIVATDVSNPFYGKEGAAIVFSPQKGADSQAVIDLDLGLRNISELIKKEFNIDLQTISGSGAGGGIGGGAVAFLKAEIKSAAQWILEINQIESKLESVDLLITGEGKIDSQTWQGKLISQLVLQAEKAEKAVILVCGTLQDVETIIAQKGVLFASSIINEPLNLEKALENSLELVENHGALLGKMLRRIQLNSPSK
jgi:glycerate 2-kinase